MKLARILFLSCAFLTVNACLLSAASVSLDTVGTDPDLNSPNFTFMTDANGGLDPTTYRNVSNPPVDFIKLTLIAPFSSGFYFGPSGPKTVGNICNGGRAFSQCSITLNDLTTTVTFEFTNGRVPYGTEFSVVASSFQPNQTISAAALTTTASPEPGAFALAAMGIALLGGMIRQKKFFKFGVRS